MRILVIDNYDSFTYNLVQYIRELINHPIEVFRNDQITLSEVDEYDCLILSPGPGLPKDAGILPEVIKKYFRHKPILGVCLGHQAIGECFGAQLENLKEVYHGVSTPINITDRASVLWNNLPDTFEIGRYHSWVIRKDSLPEELICIATDEDGQIMALKHKRFPVWGVQFHPESILTPQGKNILENFLVECEKFELAK